MRKTVYLILAILGLILPWIVFIPWLLENGLDLNLLWAQINANAMAKFAWLDVILAVLALIIYCLLEHRKQEIPLVWLPILGSLLGGVSFGLPLLLYLLEGRKLKIKKLKRH